MRKFSAKAAISFRRLSAPFFALAIASSCGENAVPANPTPATTWPATTSTQVPGSTTGPTTNPSSSAGLPQKPDPDNCVGVFPEGPPASYSIAASTTTRSSSTGTNSTGQNSAMSTSSDSTGGSGTQPSGDSTGSGCSEPPACIGHLSPLWELHDYQPLSCGYNQDYGFVDFLGTPTMVVFLAGWCGYCRSQAVGLEKLRIELAHAGYKFNFAIIHLSSANSIENRQHILDRTSIPLFQDNDFTKLEVLHAAHKDEMFLYDSGGVLRDMFLHEGTRNSNLSTPEGFQTVKQAFISVLEASF